MGENSTFFENLVENNFEEGFNLRLKTLRKRLASTGALTDSCSTHSACSTPGGLAEKAHRTRESDLAQLQRLARIGYWSWNTGSGEMVCSEEASMIICGKIRDIKSFDLLMSYVHPDDRDSFIKDVCDSLFSDIQYSSNYRVIDSAGVTRYVHSEGEVTTNGNGDPVLMFATVRDIIKRSDATAVSQETDDLIIDDSTIDDSITDLIYAITNSIEKSVEDPMNAITESMVLVTPDGTIITINDVAAQRLGSTPESMVNACCFSYMPQEVADRRRALFDEVIKLKLPVRREDLRDGRVFDQTVYPIISAGGEVIRLAVFAADVTEKRRAEQALLESEEKFRSLITQSHDGIILIDSEGVILEFNGGSEEITGITREKMIGKHIWDLQYAISPKKDARETGLSEIREESKSWISNLLTRERCTHSSRYIRRIDGQIRAIESNSFLVRTNKQPLIGSITRDVTDQKTAEAALLESLQEKDVLLKEIHHRVKNNLQVISSMMSLQIDASADPMANDVFQACQNRIKSIALIHERLYMTDHFSRISFGDYVRKLAANLYHHYKKKAENIVLTIDADDDIMMGIDTAIPCGLIVNELLTNSYKYAFPGSRTGEIRIKLYVDEKSQYQLVIADNGIGLPRDMGISDSPTLGFQLVSLLADQLEGTITINVENGTEFRITFSQNRTSDYSK